MAVFGPQEDDARSIRAMPAAGLAGHRRRDGALLEGGTAHGGLSKGGAGGTTNQSVSSTLRRKSTTPSDWCAYRAAHETTRFFPPRGDAMRIRLLIAAVLAVAVPAMATPLAQLIDFAQCKVTPGGAVTAEGGNVVITVRAGDSPDTGAELRFRQPLLTSGKDRFVMEARADELTRAYLCQSQTVFIGNDGSSLTYEPDLSFTPTWSLREVLLADMPAGLPTAVTGLRLTFWSPYNAGREMRFLMRRLEFQSTTEMAAELRLSPATRKPLPMKPVAAAPADQRWVNLGPGGGGWFRDIAISPHDGTCFVGGDVGGVYRSRDRGRTWTVCNQGLSNLYVNCVAFHPTDPHTLYAGTNGGPARSTDGLSLIHI